MAIRHIGELHLGDPSALENFALDWLERAGAAFRRGYAAATQEAGLYGPTLAEAFGATELFVLERALYELRASLGTRTDWVDVHLDGLLRHLDRGFRPLGRR